MSPGASYYPAPSRHPAHGITTAWVIAIMFATVAAISFALDQSITLSPLPSAPAATNSAR